METNYPTIRAAMCVFMAVCVWSICAVRNFSPSKANKFILSGLKDILKRKGKNDGSSVTCRNTAETEQKHHQRH